LKLSFGTSVAVGKGLVVGVGTGVFVGTAVSVGKGADVGGVGIDAGAHPLTKTVIKANARNFDPIDFFMTFSPFDLIVRRSAQRLALPAGGWDEITLFWRNPPQATQTA